MVVNYQLQACLVQVFIGVVLMYFKVSVSTQHDQLCRFMFSWYIFAYQFSFRSYVRRNIRLRSFELNVISVVKFQLKTLLENFTVFNGLKITERLLKYASFSKRLLFWTITFFDSQRHHQTLGWQFVLFDFARTQFRSWQRGEPKLHSTSQTKPRDADCNV